MDLRQSAKRNASKSFQQMAGKRLFTPGLGHQGFEAETRVNSKQALALEQLFHTHPALLAAKNVLQAQLLKGGLTLKRDGEPVELTTAFKRHIDRTWMPFARLVIEHFVVYGYCVISYEEDENMTLRPEPIASEAGVQGRWRPASGPQRDPVGRGSKADRGMDEGGQRTKEGTGRSQPQQQPKNIVPNVAVLGSYDLAFELGGRAGYRRHYKVYNRLSRDSMIVDDGVRIFVMEHPDVHGNINSSVASVMNHGSFIDTMLDLAVDGEVGRANPTVVTQARRQGAQQGANNPTDMFFDTESRDMHRSHVREDDADAQRTLQMQLELCRAINRPTDIAGASSSGAALNGWTSNTGKDVLEHPIRGSAAMRASAAAARTMSGRMFALPREQELAPYPLPQNRADLADMIRLTVEQMCSAMGVPPSMIFDARFSGQSTVQLALFNATIHQLAHFVDLVLTQAYTDIYSQSGGGSDNVVGGEPDEGDLELMTTTSPLATSQELVALHTAGLVDFEAAAPLALHAIGVNGDQTVEAIARHDKLLSAGKIDALGGITKPDPLPPLSDAPLRTTAKASARPADAGAPAEITDSDEADASTPPGSEVSTPSGAEV